MKNPVYQQVQARKVKTRLRMLQHAERLSGNVLDLKNVRSTYSLMRRCRQRKDVSIICAAAKPRHKILRANGLVHVGICHNASKRIKFRFCIIGDDE
jgi:hypothetical protein